MVTGGANVDGAHERGSVARQRESGTRQPGGHSGAGRRRARPYSWARSVTPTRRGSPGCPRINPELPVWIVSAVM